MEIDTTWEESIRDRLRRESVERERLRPRTAAEWYLCWAFFLSPIAGAVFATTKLPRLTKGLHLLWIWPVAIIVVAVYFIGFVQDHPITPLVVVWVVNLAIYAFMKIQLRNGKFSIVATAIAAFCAVGSVFPTLATLSMKQPIMDVGSSYEKNSAALLVRGQDYRVGKTLYARVQDGLGLTFGSTQVEFILKAKVGTGGWDTITTQTIPISPDDAVVMEPFSVRRPGTYQASFMDGTRQISSVTFVAH